MQPPAELLKRGIKTLPTIGDGRQSGTSASPSILNVSPEAAVGGGIALLKTGDKIRIDLKSRKVDVILPEGELAGAKRGSLPRCNTRPRGRRFTVASWGSTAVGLAWSRPRFM